METINFIKVGNSSCTAYFCIIVSALGAKVRSGHANGSIRLFGPAHALFEDDGAGLRIRGEGA